MKKIIFITFFVLGLNASGQEVQKIEKRPVDFVPPGYIITAEIKGDLNKDNQTDSVLIIKGTDKTKIFKDEYRGDLDRNRRGIMIALKSKDNYELVLENLNCFSSENEDGNGYFPPELGVFVEKGILLIHYFRGKYGFLSYKFRYQNSDFELIGYDSSNSHGPVVDSVDSINLMTKKIMMKNNVNKDAEDGGDEKFVTTWMKVSIPKPVKLKDIVDFDEFNIFDVVKTY